MGLVVDRLVISGVCYVRNEKSVYFFWGEGLEVNLGGLKGWVGEERKKGEERRNDKII
jgi:hypothetical protein